MAVEVFVLLFPLALLEHSVCLCLYLGRCSPHHFFWGGLTAKKSCYEAKQEFFEKIFF